MANVQDPAIPAPPNIITSLRAGFDAVASHVVVIFFPALLDLLLWLGPHIQIKKLLLDMLTTITSSPGWSTSQSGALLSDNLEALKDAASRINLLTSLRSFPVGVPSLMAGRLPIEIPGGQPIFWDVSNPWVIISISLLLFVLGLGIGSLYFSLIAQAVTNGKILFRIALKDWPRAMFQVLSLTLALVIILLVISIPTSCVLSIVAWGGISIGQIGIFLYLGILMWLAFPLIFTPHGIFANQSNVLVALRKSVRVARMTLPSTSLLFLAIILISEGMDILWRIPAENSWFVLIGMAGHAFVTSSLLAATFVYYRDADRWVQSMLEKISVMRVKVNP
jgi:hypothetical protein